MGLLVGISIIFILQVQSIVYFKFFEKKSKFIRILYITGSLFILGYMASQMMLMFSDNSSTAKNWAKISFASILIAIPILYSTLISFFKKSKMATLFSISTTALSAFLLSATLFTDLIIKGVVQKSWGFYPDYTFLVLGFPLLFPMGFWFIAQTAKRDTLIPHRWINYMIILSIFFLLDFLPVVSNTITPITYILLIITSILLFIFVKNVSVFGMDNLSASQFIEKLPDPVLILDKELNIIQANGQFYHHFGAEKINNQGFTINHIPGLTAKKINGSKLKTIETVLLNQNKELTPYILKSEVIEDSGCCALFIYENHLEADQSMRLQELSRSCKSLKTEMTTLKDELQTITKSRDLYSVAIQGTETGLFDWNISQCNIIYSRQWKTLLGFRNYEMSPSPKEWLDRIHPEDIQSFISEIEATVFDKKPKIVNEHRIRLKNKKYEWFNIEAVPVFDIHSNLERLTGTIRNISNRKEAETELFHNLFHDRVTGLPNKLSLMEQLTAEYQYYLDDPKKKFSLLLMDLDRFKSVNENLGMNKADKILKKAGKRIQQAVGSKHQIFRFAGDEFVLMASTIEQAIFFAEEIKKGLARKIKSGSDSVELSVSIGISEIKAEMKSPEELVSEADMALNMAKEKGRNGYSIFDTDIGITARKILTMEHDLKEALENGDFTLAYQPIVNMETGRIIALETLIRWEHKIKGNISPAIFIPMAEHTDLIIPIGQWVMENACIQVAKLETQFELEDDFSVNINVSGKQLKSPRFTDTVRRILTETGVNTSRIVIEIAENSIIDDIDKTRKILTELGTMGLRFHLDDFGEGYTSLKILRDLPIETMKIDKSFITGVELEDEQRLIVKSIIDLGRNMGKKIVAEGIEKKKEMDTLMDINCTMGQGFYFYRPIKESNIIDFFNKNGKDLFEQSKEVLTEPVL